MRLRRVAEENGERKTRSLQITADLAGWPALTSIDWPRLRLKPRNSRVAAAAIAWWSTMATTSVRRTTTFGLTARNAAEAREAAASTVGTGVHTSIARLVADPAHASLGRQIDTHHSLRHFGGAGVAGQGRCQFALPGRRLPGGVRLGSRLLPSGGVRHPAGEADPKPDVAQARGPRSVQPLQQFGLKEAELRGPDAAAHRHQQGATLHGERERVAREGWSGHLGPEPQGQELLSPGFPAALTQYAAQHGVDPVQAVV